MRFLAVFEIFLANLFWGFGFTATIWCLESFNLTQILALRFTAVGLVGLALALSQKPRQLKKLLTLTALPAVFLVVEILFQIWGLSHTTATKGAFLTVMYIVIVPVIDGFLFRKEIPVYHWLWVAVALAGAILMIQLESFDLSYGDFLILVSALGASLHILSVDRIGKREKNLFLANTWQSLWGALFFLPLALFQSESWPAQVTTQAWIGLASLTFGSTMLAFYFQMRAQRSLPPSVSSILFLLESPIAAVFAFLLNGDRMTPLQWFGCGLILLAGAGVTTLNSRENRAAKNTIAASSAGTEGL